MKGLLGKIVKIAGPAAGGFLAGGPAGAGAAVLGQLTAGGAKKDGQRRRAASDGLSPRLIRAGHHKVTSPAAALSIPVLVSILLTELGIDMPEQQVSALIGLITWASHALGRRAEKGAGG